MSKEKKELGFRNSLLNLIIVFLAIVLFTCVCVLGNRINQKSNGFTSEKKYLEGYIKRGDYAGLVYDWRQNLKYGKTLESNPEYKDVYAVAEYYSILPEYVVFVEKGYSDKAAEYEKRLSQARKDMGAYDFLADEFDTIYGLK